MISQFRIGNFKAFGDGQQAVPLKPLTIIFGPNSSGKSSILHSLLFAHHAARTGNMDVVYPELAEETVDLGGFRQFIHGAQRGVENRLSWAADCSGRDLARYLDARRSELNRQLGGSESNDWKTLTGDTTTFEISLSIGIPRDNTGKPIPAARPCVARMECLADKKLLLSAFSIDGRTLQVDQVASDHPLISRIANNLAVAGTFVLELTAVMRDRIAKEIDSLVADLQVETDGFLPRKLHDAQSKLRSGTDGETRRPELGGVEGVANAIRRALPRMLDELVVGMADLIRKDLYSISYLGPLRSYPPRHIAFTEAKDLGSRAGGGHAWLNLAYDADLRAKVNAWLSDASRLKTPYQMSVEGFYRYRDVEEGLSRSTEEIAFKAADAILVKGTVEGSAEIKALLDDYVSTEQADDAAALRPILEQCIDTEALHKQHVRKVFLDAFAEGVPRDVVLLDMRTNTKVSHRDVGIGVSQVLPVLVNAYGAKDQILAIEQPEIHLHPALQSELGDVFIESALGGGGNRCVLETHSEHLILRVLRRIREASRQAKPAITPDDVCVLYVHPQKTGSQVMEMRISKDGQFLDPWPEGFFVERLREMLGA